MKTQFKLITPKSIPVLDPDFKPPVLANRAFIKEVQASGAAIPLLIAVERDQHRVSRLTRRFLT